MESYYNRTGFQSSSIILRIYVIVWITQTYNEETGDCNSVDGNIYVSTQRCDVSCVYCRNLQCLQKATLFTNSYNYSKAPEISHRLICIVNLPVMYGAIFLAAHSKTLKRWATFEIFLAQRE